LARDGAGDATSGAGAEGLQRRRGAARRHWRVHRVARGSRGVGGGGRGKGKGRRRLEGGEGWAGGGWREKKRN
jgi:hypothetical protein